MATENERETSLIDGSIDEGVGSKRIPSRIGSNPWLLSPLTVEIADYLSMLQEEVELALDQYSRLSPDSPVRLTEAMRYSLLTPGKRLRPILALIAVEMCGGVRADALPVCAALELTHTYSLIHDDLPAMDNDDLRRGVPTCHKKFDEATAILAGDALLTLAFETLATRIADPLIAARLVATLAVAVGPCGMVGGQADDVLWSAVIKDNPAFIDLLGELTQNLSGDQDKRSCRNSVLSDFLHRIHRRKTGRLIVASLELGAISVGALDSQIEALRSYGENLGQAFQISDDLLDETGDENVVGKRVGKDKESGKLTYVSLYGTERAKILLEEAVDNAKSSLFAASSLFDANSTSFIAAVQLADYTARRGR